MCKCPIEKCKSSCCYNVPFDPVFLIAHEKEIVTPILTYIHPPGRDHVVPVTNANWEQNKCPFLRADYRCNVYEIRPTVCRMMAQVPTMSCPLLKRFTGKDLIP